MLQQLVPIVLGLRLSLGGTAPATPLEPPVGPPAAAPSRFPDSRRANREKPAPPERWFAEDKLQHFFMSAAVTSFVFAAVRTAGAEGDAGLVAAGGAAAAAGLWKEWRDRRAGELFSLRDLVWDAAGIGAALALARETR